MAKETVTDLLYQYIRAVVTAGFRDGMVSGAREAMGLPALGGLPAPEMQPEPGDERDDDGAPRTSPPKIRAASLPAKNPSARQLPPAPVKKPPALGGPGALTGPAPEIRRGRGRPRKHPLPPAQAPTSAVEPTAKSITPAQGENPTGEKSST
jgi:hypothetical protein